MNERHRILTKSLAASWIILSRSSHALGSKTECSTPIIRSGGLINLGNTCYLNSQLQCAYHIPLGRDLILSSKTSPAQTALSAVFHSMSPKTGSTLPLCRTLGINPLLQQDAQEFWKLLLPELKLDAFVDLYQGSYEDYIVARDGSGREKRHEEIFLDLSVEVDSPCLESSLSRQFREPELLRVAEGNGWRPDKDSEKVDALKGCRLYVEGLPPLLQFHLMRFRYCKETYEMIKINSRFTFPLILDLSEICTDVTTPEQNFRSLYDLQSVIIHKGRYGSGHYYAYVRPDVRDEKWYRYDDHAVTEVSFREVVEDAFGGRKRGILDWFTRGEEGWGGSDSSAYMLQYVKRWDVPELYGERS